jgi:DNA (cytosine-5)-methyltransferase 1
VSGGLYFNEFDSFPAWWLRRLYPAGEVDTRSIHDVRPEHVLGRRRAHFFAGIGGWELALALAGWPADVPVWTGSCPCQPFSDAGKRLGEADERHLWPEFRRLIGECRPPVVFGEQVASASGRGWLAGVRADLEALGYAVGAADLCAAGVAAPHILQRLYWVAYSTDSDGWSGVGGAEEGTRAPEQRWRRPASRGAACRRGDSDVEGRRERGEPEHRDVEGSPGAEPDGSGARGQGAWSDYVVVPCGDGKARRLGAGVQPLVDGFPGRVGRVRAYGNAIVPQVAAAFIAAAMPLVLGELTA